jgi:putative flavoprotein involved in K+ transport
MSGDLHARSDIMMPEIEAIVIGAGQSGLAAARALQAHGIRPVVLEAGPEPVGSWPHYYDSLTLFSPAGYSSMPGLDFPGEVGHYPHRDEVVSYLRRYADGLDADIRTSTPVTAVQAHGQTGFLVQTVAGQAWHAAGVVAATGSFGHPYVPALPGQDRFTGRLQHVASYRSPGHYAGERVVVVGAGNSAIQVGYELAQVPRSPWPLATRSPSTRSAAAAMTCTTGWRPPASTCSRRSGCGTPSAAAGWSTRGSTSTPCRPGS